MAYGRRDIRGGAAQTTLSSGITNSATSCAITASTGWPDGATYAAFYVVIDPGLATEEKILCSTRSSLTVNFTTRGVDGTSAAAHSSGAAIYPCVTAVDLDEANLAVQKLLGQATTIGQMPYVDAANSFAMLQAKTSGSIIVGNGTIPAVVAVSGDATLASTGALTIAANAVTNAKAAAMTRGTTKVGNSAGAASDLAIGAANTVLATDGTDPSWRKIVSADVGFVFATWTPVVTQSGAVTKTVTYAKYVQFGKFVMAQCLLAITGSGTTANDISITVPVTAATSGAFLTVGEGTTVISAAANMKSVALTSTSVVKFIDSAAPLYSGWNVGLANGDVLSFTIMYEAA